MFPEHQRSIVGIKKRRKEKEKKEKPPKPPKEKKQSLLKNKNEITNNGEVDVPDASIEWDENMLNIKEELEEEIDDSKPSSPLTGTMPSKRGRKKGSLNKTPEVMAARRRKVWQLMAKKELGKVQRAKANNHKETVQSCKRVATMCMKVFKFL